MALNLMERMAAGKTEAKTASSRKRTWSSTNSDAGSSSSLSGGGDGGGGGRPTHRSTSWRETRNRQDAGFQGGYGTDSATIMPGPAAATATAAGDFRVEEEEVTAGFGKATAPSSMADSTATVAAGAERFK
jgi:hypothetical protein